MLNYQSIEVFSTTIDQSDLYDDDNTPRFICDT